MCNNPCPVSARLVYDGRCQFCCRAVNFVKRWDWLDKIEVVDYHSGDDPAGIHAQLTKEMVQSRLHLIEPDQKLFAGFFSIRRLCFKIPLLFPFIIVMYFPGMIIVGPLVYALVARNRYLFHANSGCKDNSCFR